MLEIFGYISCLFDLIFDLSVLEIYIVKRLKGLVVVCFVGFDGFIYFELIGFIIGF